MGHSASEATLRDAGEQSQTEKSRSFSCLLWRDATSTDAVGDFVTRGWKQVFRRVYSSMVSCDIHSRSYRVRESKRSRALCTLADVDSIRLEFRRPLRCASGNRRHLPLRESSNIDG